jgi:hypothetical protein
LIGIGGRLATPPSHTTGHTGPSLNKTLVLELARSEYATRRENVIAVGNSGTGKTHVALGIGLAACQKGCCHANDSAHPFGG